VTPIVMLLNYLMMAYLYFASVVYILCFITLHYKI